jgi:hypothetical protein
MAPTMKLNSRKTACTAHALIPSSALVLLLAACAVSAAATPATEYRVVMDNTNPQSVGITAQRANPDIATVLVLRGASFGAGVAPQVENVSCDGSPLANAGGNARWTVPKGCKLLSWKIPLDAPGATEASRQRSVYSANGSFRFLSEASSLPRLEHPQGTEFLVVPKSAISRTIPEPSLDGRVPLPDYASPPLFLLLASRPIARHAVGALKVSYFIDDPSQHDHLPPIEQIAEGLRWLTSLARKDFNTSFTYAWLGMSDSARAVGGAAGKDVLAVNYIRGGSQDANRAAMIAAMPLIEATHFLASSFGERPTWVEESLATYLGLKASMQATAQSRAAADVLRKFEEDGTRFPIGLLEAQRRVSGGDTSMYPAFFTKGVAYWSAMDAALRNASRPDVASRIVDLWTARYDKAGRPPEELGRLLGLPPDLWRQLSTKFLD